VKKAEVLSFPKIPHMSSFVLHNLEIFSNYHDDAILDPPVGPRGGSELEWLNDGTRLA